VPDLPPRRAKEANELAIFLIRHGETAANAARVLQTPDAPLSSRGLAQAERLAGRLAGESIGGILSSDFQRAVMTAERVRAATRAPLALEPLLQERNFGALRGTPYAELDEDPFGPDYVPPGGESWQALHVRVDAAWKRVRAEAAATRGDLVVVTHGLVCWSLVTRHLELGEEPAPVRFGNTSVTLLEAEPPYRVRLLDCTAHLDEARSSSPRSGLA
jgi:broad specificity phosphatase PhoE